MKSNLPILLDKIKCYVIHYNRPTMLKVCLGELLLNPSLEVIVVDNNSDIVFDSMGCEVIQMSKNMGHSVVWGSGISKRLSGDDMYIVTDCDIVVPDGDYLGMLLQGLDKYPNVNKIGLDLNTRDIPLGYKYRKEVIEHEKGYIMRKKIRKVKDYVFAPVDTTFALYRSGYHSYSEWGTGHSGDNQTECRSMRVVGDKWEAFHLGWGIIEPYNEEICHYFNTIKDCQSGHWKEVGVNEKDLIDTEK